MYALKSAATAAMLLAIPAVNAAGNAIINNQCSFPIYLWPTVGQTAESMQTIAPHSQWSQPFQQVAVGGVSLKMSLTPSQGSISQYEYTLNGPDTPGMLFYDISSVNGDPLQKYGYSMESSDSSCPSFTCAAGVVCLDNVYYAPHDDTATKGCSSGANPDVTMNICLGGTSGSPPASQPPAPAAAPAPSQVSDPLSVVAGVAAAAAPAAAPPDNHVKVVTTFSTEVVPAATPAPTAHTSSNPDDWSVLSFPDDNAEAMAEFGAKAAPPSKRSMRVHRHHQHLQPKSA